MSIFIDESGDFGPVEAHSPYYVISLVFHDQSDDITGHLDKIHDALVARGLPAGHGIHTGPLIRRERDYRWLDVRERRSLFRVLVDFVRTTDISHRSWVFTKKDVGDANALVSIMSRELGAFIRDNFGYFQSWDHDFPFEHRHRTCAAR
ncbi:MAG: DUF3800 domain-containing protein [Aeromicrobium sp.]|uniref:DUF3800 domain-containing protein n=1 Tax=Aeromicrobium sp. TaxID=1871063 RepID=UPI0039E21F59